MSLSDEIMKDIEMGKEPKKAQKKKQKKAVSGSKQKTPKTLMGEERVDLEHLGRLSDEDVGAETYPAEKV